MHRSNSKASMERKRKDFVGKAVLERSGSLPKIDLKLPGYAGEKLPYPFQPSLSFDELKIPRKEPELSLKPDPSILPNTKKLRMRSFLWIKPTSYSASTQRILRQLLPVLIANIGSLSSGLSLGYSAILLPQLKPNDLNSTSSFNHYDYHPFTANMEAGSWIASIFGLGAIFGGFAAACLGNKFGRRIAILVMSMIDLLSWTMIAASQNLAMILIGRWLAGFAAAGYSPMIQIYVAEITQAKHRGWMSALTLPIMSIGTLLIYVIGSFLPWHLSAVCCIPLPIVLALGMSFCYDSPHWYVQNGEERKAFKSLDTTRGGDVNVLAELFEIQEMVRKSSSEVPFFEGVKTIFKERKYFRPFLILNVLFLFMIFSGRFAIEFYAVSIFEKLGGNLNEYVSAVIVAAIQLGGSLMYMMLIRKVPRKLLIVFSALTMAAALTTLGAWSFAKVEGQVPWVPLFSIVLYMVSAPIGLCSIPFLYIAEFFPTEMRSVLGGITIALSNLELFIVVKTFPNLQHLLGDHTVFWFYAGACVLAIFFTLSYIPETKDRSLLQVEDKFSRRKTDTIRVSPWVTPLNSPNPSVRKLHIKSTMFTN